MKRTPRHVSTASGRAVCPRADRGRTEPGPQLSSAVAKRRAVGSSPCRAAASAAGDRSSVRSALRRLSDRIHHRILLFASLVVTPADARAAVHTGPSPVAASRPPGSRPRRSCPPRSRWRAFLRHANGRPTGAPHRTPPGFAACAAHACLALAIAGRINRERANPGNGGEMHGARRNRSQAWLDRGPVVGGALPARAAADRRPA